MNINKPLNQLCAILLAKAIVDLYPDVMLGDYQLSKDGFSYSFLSSAKISTNDFNKIIKQMQKNIDRAYEIKYTSTPKDEAKKLFINNRFKLALIEQNLSTNVSLIYLGDDFFDLCEDLKITKLSNIKSFDLTNVAGSY
jgi:threonyl-tRNA synthetase